MNGVVKSTTNDPLDVVGVLQDLGGPYTTTSATFETIAESTSEIHLPLGTYMILTTGTLLNTQNNAEGDFRVLAAGAEVISSHFAYESGTQDVPKTFFLQTVMRVAGEPRPPGALTELQAMTNAGTLTISDLVVTFFMLAKRDVEFQRDLTPQP